MIEPNVMTYSFCNTTLFNKNLSTGYFDFEMLGPVYFFSARLSTTSWILIGVMGVGIPNYVDFIDTILSRNVAPKTQVK